MSDIEVVFDHPDFLIINKPVGIPVQNETNLKGILPRLCKQIGISQLWLVHRLDKVTSGLLILAKTKAAASALSQMFAKRQVSKYYLALCDKSPKKKQGLVTGDMRKVRNGVWMLLNSQAAPAVSQFFSYGIGNGLRLMVIKPWTGKTHQIRVMMKSLGAAILGDIDYKGSPSDRTYLHAYALQFVYQEVPFEITCLPQFGEHFSPQFSSLLREKADKPEKLNWPTLKPGLIKLIGHTKDEDAGLYEQG